MHGVKAGDTIEVDAAEACRLVTYGCATPADAGPAERIKVGARVLKFRGDAALATSLRNHREAGAVPLGGDNP